MADYPAKKKPGRRKREAEQERQRKLRGPGPFELRSKAAAKTARCYRIALAAVDKGLTEDNPEAVLKRTAELVSLNDQSLDEVEKIITDYPMPPELSKTVTKAMETLDDAEV